MPPVKTQGVRLPNTERVRSERLPAIRFDRSETIAVMVLRAPNTASLFATPMSVSRCGSRTPETIIRPPIHKNENSARAAAKRMVSAVNFGRVTCGVPVVPVSVFILLSFFVIR